ncbi:MAG: DUF4168 domain-containing protein, partial [Candidatus Binatia bacterium]
RTSSEVGIMRQFILWNIVLAIVVGFLGPWSSRGTALQEPSQKSSQESSMAQQRPGEAADFVSERLQAFARTYVAIRRLIEEYDPALGTGPKTEQAQRLEREALAKVQQTLDVHGFTPDSFQRTFALVNADDELRNKALELIAAEREKLQS